MRRLAVVLAAGALLAGCGGSSSDGTSTAFSDILNNTGTAGNESSAPSPTSSGSGTAPKPKHHKKHGASKSISDPSGDVGIPGIDITHARAFRHANGDLSITIQLAAAHVRDGIYVAWVQTPNGGLYQVNADILPGEKDYGVFDMNAGQNAKAAGVADGNLILLTALASDLGWTGHGRYKVSFEAQAGESSDPPTDKAPRNGWPGHGHLVV